MKNLKHILIYEAFSAKTISKTLNFINAKIGKDQKKRFLNVLKKIKDRYDYPIDLIKDEHMDYLSKKEAFLLKSEGEVKNPYGIKYLKFWFSLEKGYLGYSGAGNRVISYDRDHHNKRENEPLTQRDISYLIDNNILPNKGKLITINDYKYLKHLDKCAIQVDGEFTLATLWIYPYEGRHKLFAVQNVASGDNPREYGDRRDWREYGEYSWSMGSIESPGSDHYKLHKYEVDEEPLRVVNQEEEKEEVKVENPLDYNLPLNSYGKLTYWGDQSSIDSEEKIEEADFAIILDFDEMISSDYTNPSYKRSQRTESRVGATKLLTDNDVRRANIERYIGELLKKLGINKNEFTPKNLQKIILMTLQGEFALMTCKLGHINSIADIIPRISDLISVHKKINEYSNETIENYHKRLLDQYKKMYNTSNERRSNLKGNIEKLKKYYNSGEASKSIGRLRDGTDPVDDIKIILNKTFEIGQKIYDGIEKLPVDNIVDLKIIYQKLRSIRTLVNDEDEFYIGRLEYMTYLTQYENDISDTTYSLNRLSTSERKQTIEALNNIEKYVDSVFK